MTVNQELVRAGAEVEDAVGAGSVWTANHNGYSVSQINPRTDKIVRTIPLGSSDNL